MDDYEVYKRAVALSSIPIQPMTRAEFTEAVKYASVIEWDHDEERRYGATMHALDILK